MKIMMKVKDILDNEKLIEQTGINVWAVNEGLATGEEFEEVEIDSVNLK